MMFTLTQGIDLTSAATELGEDFAIMDGSIRIADYSAGTGARYRHMATRTGPSEYQETGRCNVVCRHDGLEHRVAHNILTMPTGRTVLMTGDDLEQHFECLEG